MVRQQSHNIESQEENENEELYNYGKRNGI